VPQGPLWDTFNVINIRKIITFRPLFRLRKRGQNERSDVRVSKRSASTTASASANVIALARPCATPSRNRRKKPRQINLQRGFHTNPFFYYYGFTPFPLFAGGGIIGVGVVPAPCAVEAFLTCSLYFELADVSVPPFTATFMAMANTIKNMASPQVPFSRKSPVFCTPINCDELEKFDDKPPPLGFCINTINTNNTQTTIDTISKNWYIMFN